MNILNLYAGIGGNRKLWGNDIDVTAVEWDEQVAAVYQHMYPNDKVVVSDAHQYLLDHFEEYDFIWSSPPCPTHSRINFTGTRGRDYPDMNLYQEIIFLKSWFKGDWVVENVIPFYTPLIDAYECDRHLFWSNKPISEFEPESKVVIRDMSKISQLEDALGIYLPDMPLKGKRQKLRNCVNPETGLHVFNEVTQ